MDHDFFRLTPRLSSPSHEPWPINSGFERRGNRVGLRINTNKTNVVSLTGDHSLPICINEQNVESITQFVDSDLKKSQPLT